MEDKENLQDVLSELKKVLGDLTKDEKQQVVGKIEKKLGEVNDVFQKKAETATPQASAPKVEFYQNTKVPVSGPDPVAPPASVTIKIKQVPVAPAAASPAPVTPPVISAHIKPDLPAEPVHISIPRIFPITSKPAAPEAPVSQVKPSPAVTPPAAVVPPVFQVKTPVIQKTEAPASSLFPSLNRVISKTEIPATTEKTSQYSQTIKFSPAVSKPDLPAQSFKPVFRQAQPVQEQPTAPKPADLPAPGWPGPEKAQEKAAAAQPQEDSKIIKSNAFGVMVELPKQSPGSEKEGLLKFGCFYPAGQEETKDTFIKNLLDVFKKTSKKPITPEDVLEMGIDVSTVDWKDVINKCREKDVKVMFLIHVDEYNPSEIKNRVLGSGMFFYAIQTAHINRKLTYVDLVIELMLHKS